MEVDRVKCFYVVIIGYVLLIFNFDDQCDYIRFLDKCKFVWKELKIDSQLLLKLVIFSVIIYLYVFINLYWKILDVFINSIIIKIYIFYLLQKDIKRQLEWLNSVKFVQGSVEVIFMR